MDVPLSVPYHAAATVFQFVVAAVLLAGRPTFLRYGFALVVFLSGVETLEYALGAVDRSFLPLAALQAVDIVIVLTLPFLMLHIPRPVGRWSVALWATLVAAWVACAPYYIRSGGQAVGGPSNPSDALFVVFQVVPVFVAAAILVHWALPRWARMRPGLLHRRTLLLLLGTGMGLLMWAGEAFLERVVVPLRDGAATEFGSNTAAYYVATFPARDFGYLILFGTAMLILLLAWRRHRSAGLLLLAYLIAFFMGLRLTMVAEFRIAEFPSQVIRPATVALAFVGYDALDKEGSLRRYMLNFVSWSAAPLLFMVSLIVLNPDGMAATTIPAPSALGAALVVALGYVAARRWLWFVRGDAAALRQGSLDRYRMALEEGEPRDALRSLRRRLGISRDQHAALRAILATNTMVPTVVVAGLKPGDVVAGHTVLQELGAGGMGRAWLAEDLDGRRWVIKEVLRPWEEDAGRLAALRREARVAARVEHPNIARVEGMVSHRGLDYLVREHVPGTSLAEWLKEVGTPEAAQQRRLARELAEAIEHLHEAGYVRLDLKPDNIIVRPDGRPVLIDMGTIKGAVDATVGDETVALATGGAGSMPWMAPEQLAGAPADEATDWWTYGAVLHQLLRGRPPVEHAGRTAYEVRQQILTGRPPRPGPDEDPELAALRSACLERNAEARMGKVRPLMEQLLRKR
ncbi:MAG: serine/threonine-protein kinase [Thermoplasmatota archaeon]